MYVVKILLFTFDLILLTVTASHLDRFMKEDVKMSPCPQPNFDYLPGIPYLKTLNACMRFLDHDLKSM